MLFANTTSSSKMVANASRERIKPKAILLATGFIQIKFMVQKERILTEKDSVSSTLKRLSD